MKKSNSRAGFTLIELIATLVLSGVVTVFAAMLLVTSAQVYLTGINAGVDSQKLQVAMNRLAKELTSAQITGTSAQTITWTSRHPERDPTPQTVAWNGTAGSPLLLSGAPLLNPAPLLDTVGSFSVATTTTPYSVTISLSSQSAPGVVHTTKIYPRHEPSNLPVL